MAKVPDGVLSHWSTLIESFQVSPLAFYQAVEAALRRREIPLTQKSRVDYKEAGLLSANREYLRVTREKLILDVCAAPFGTGFFVSWWLAEKDARLNPLLQILFVIGLLLIATWSVSVFGLVVGVLVYVIGILSGLAGANGMAMNGEFDDNIIRALPILG